jgi:molybdopterin molybdotransferase
MVADSSNQHISRLAPLGAVLALIGERVRAVDSQTIPVEAALNAVLAEDVVVPALPPHAIALRDGFAVEAALVGDAGPYAPVILPDARRVDLGEPLPEATDAIMPLDAVALRGERLEAIASVAVGDGVLAAGGDAAPQRPLRRSGDQIRAIDIAVLRAAGIKTVAVRIPRVTIGRARAKRDAAADERLALLSRAVSTAGGIVAPPPIGLEAALIDGQADAIIGVGGTGSGRHDAAIGTLAKFGRVEFHGIAISPGETAAFGFVGERPVLLLPGRLDAMLAAWLLLGRYLVAGLGAGDVASIRGVMPLKRKVTSTIGMRELIPVRCVAGMAEPLASGYLSLATLANSDGWIAVPADSEGFAADTIVAVNPWP